MVSPWWKVVDEVDDGLNDELKQPARRAVSLTLEDVTSTLAAPGQCTRGLALMGRRAVADEQMDWHELGAEQATATRPLASEPGEYLSTVASVRKPSGPVVPTPSATRRDRIQPDDGRRVQRDLRECWGARGFDV